MRRKKRKTVITLGLVLSGLLLLIFQWVIGSHFSIHDTSAAKSNDDNSANNSNGATPAVSPQDNEPRFRVNACKDLYAYVCSSRRVGDPTGAVRHDSQGEVDALRIYESLIKSNPKLPSQEIDELLVKRIYTPKRTKRVRDLFANAREQLLSFLESPAFSRLSQEERAALKQRVSLVELQLPPPARIYADEPDLFTRNDVFFERLSKGQLRVRVGGALLFTVKSKFNLAFTMAHELAHSIDPCEVKSLKLANLESYREILQCLDPGLVLTSPEIQAKDLERVCSAQGQISELFADWVATHLVAKILAEQRSYSKAQLRFALYNSVRDLCQDTDDDDDNDENENESRSNAQATEEDVEPFLSSSHPPNEVRVNQIFARHPKIRRMLGCKDSAPRPASPGSAFRSIANNCYWVLPSSGLPSAHK